MKRALVCACLAAAVVVACSDSDVQMPLPKGPSAAIIDGAHDLTANPRAFFLPPLVGSPPSSFPVAFDDEAIPTIEVCRQAVAEGACIEVVKRINPTEVTGRADHYLAGLNMSEITRPNPNGEKFFQINILFGNSTAGILAFLARRDIAVNSTACSDDQEAPILCVSQNENVPIKFWLGVGAGCFTQGVGIEPRCAFTTVHGQTSSTITISDNTDVTAVLTAPGLDPNAPLVFGNAYALRWEILPFEECNEGALDQDQELGLEDGGFHPMQWFQIPQCYRAVTATATGADVDINSALDGLAEYTIYFDHIGPLPDYVNKLRLARMSLNRQELQILERSDLAGTSSHSQAPSLGTRLWRFARALFDGTLFAPKQVYAASGSGLLVVRDEGVGGLAGKSIIGVVYPALLTHDDETDVADGTIEVGVVAPGAAVTVAVRAKDEGGIGVQGNEVTYVANNSGDRFNALDSTTITSDADGYAGGTWTIASDATGVRTLTASCFPCSNPLVTGDDKTDAVDENDPKWYYDDVFPLSAHPVQTITFRAVVLSLSVDPIPSRGVVGQLFPVTICIGASVPNVVIDFAGRANNGTPTEVRVNGVPGQYSLNTTNVTFLANRPGCFTTMISVTKEGGVRLIVSIRDTSLLVETNKSNIRPS